MENDELEQKNNKNLSFFTFKAQINRKVSDFRSPESTITQLSHKTHNS
jgi:hypothetical protein